VLPEQNGQEPVRRDEAYEVAFLADHREGALLMLDRSPSDDLPVGVRGNHWRIWVHDLTNYGSLRRREELFLS
jgi:hypothetical protein